MQFTVPQFIDVEDKIIGPFTFKQFLYLAGSLGLAYGLYRFVTPIISIPIGLAIVALGVTLTFYKVNGKPFIFILQAFISFSTQAKLYIWKKELPKQKQDKVPEKQPEDQVASIPKLTESQLSDLSWSLDVLDMKEDDE